MRTLAASTSRKWALLALALACVWLVKASAQTPGQQQPIGASHSNKTNRTRPARLRLGDKCLARASCRARQEQQFPAAAPGALAHAARPSCQCDERCAKFDDCCADSKWAQPFERRLAANPAELRRRRHEFQCRRVSPLAGELLVRAKCSADWLRAQPDARFAELTRLKCELAGGGGGSDLSRSQNASGSNNLTTTTAPELPEPPELPDDWLQADPMGSMMPITNLLTGVTYLNSHCVRCNLNENTIDLIATARQLIYWTPLVRCNYNAELDDRNKLYELIASRRGQALKYSHKRRHWFISAPSPPSLSPPSDSNSTSSTIEPANSNGTLAPPEVESRLKPGASEAAEEEEAGQEGGEEAARSCAIVPTIPERAERLIRRCRVATIDACKSPARPDDCEMMRNARLQCQHGHQALVYSQTSNAAYFNLACAQCNREPSVSCEPRARAHHHKPGGGGGGEPTTSGRLNSTARKLDDQLEAKRVVGNETSAAAAAAAPSPADDAADDASSSWEWDEGEEEPSEAPATLGGDLLEMGAHARSGPGGSFAVLFDMEFLRGAGAPGELTTGSGGAEPEGPAAAASDESTATAAAGQSEAQPAAPAVAAAAKRCFGNQYFDFFANKCRCAICGVWKRYINGACVPIPERDKASNLLVEASGGPIESTTAMAPASSSSGAQLNQTSTRVTESAKGLAPSTPSAATTRETNATSTTTTTTTAAPTALPLVTASKPGAGEHEDRKLQPQEEATAATTAAAEEAPALTDERVFARIKELPWPSVESRRLFAECAKTLVEPNFYRLFTMSDLLAYERAARNSTGAAKQQVVASLANSTTTTTTVKSARISQAATPPVDAHLRSLTPDSSQLVWAHVAPYNLTLPSSQFELVRYGLEPTAAAGNESAPAAAEEAPVQFGLHICLPAMPAAPAPTSLARAPPSAAAAAAAGKSTVAMVYLTTCCLAISIASLISYLLLYYLSTFDLRHLVVRMSRADQTATKWRPSCRSGSDTSYNATRSRSLSSRGVACLASSLLAAYLLFILGHQQAPPGASPSPSGSGPPAPPAASGSCRLIAALTLCSFLLAFNWMFLLSYDIWRILRLATYQLRAPAAGSQSRRFLVYAALACFSALLITSIALALDSLDASSSKCNVGQQLVAPAGDSMMAAPHLNGSSCTSARFFKSELDRFVHTYKPRFGQRPGSCWFSNRRSLGLLFGLPVTIIVLLNLAFFLHSSFMVIRTSSRSSMKPAAAAARSAGGCPAPVPRVRTTIVTPGEAREAQKPPKQQQQDFTQENNLTTNSISSVRTIQSALSLESDAENSGGGGNGGAPSASDESSRRGSCASEGAAGDDSAPEGAASPTGSRAAAEPRDADSERQLSRQLEALKGRSSLAINLEQARELQRQVAHIVACEKRRKWFQKRPAVHEEPAGSAAGAPVAGERVEERRQKVSSASLLSQGSQASQYSSASLGASLARSYDARRSQLGAFMGSLRKDYRLYCRLSTIMGLTWLTGLAASVVDQSEALWYLFVVLNTLQGLFIFIAFGFKRSRLTNVEILRDYAAFKLRQWRRAT